MNEETMVRDMRELDVIEAGEVPQGPGCKVRFFLNNHTHLYEISGKSLGECILGLRIIELNNGGNRAYWRRYSMDGRIVSVPPEEEEAVTGKRECTFEEITSEAQ